MLYKLMPHNHVRYVWLIPRFIERYHAWGYLLAVVIEAVLFGCSILWAVVPLPNWSLFKFNSSLVSLVEGSFMSESAYLSQRKESHCIVLDRVLGNSYWGSASRFRSCERNVQTQFRPTDLAFGYHQYPRELTRKWGVHSCDRPGAVPD
jgi:hypothetical protein